MGASIYTRTGKEKSPKMISIDTWAHDLNNKNLLLHLLHPGRKQSYLERRAMLGEFKDRFAITFGDFKKGKRGSTPWLKNFKLGQELD